MQAQIKLEHMLIQNKRRTPTTERHEPVEPSGYNPDHINTIEDGDYITPWCPICKFHTKSYKLPPTKLLSLKFDKG